MTALRWTRERAKAGPGDTLNDRWEVRKFGGERWAIYDRTRRSRSSNGQVGNAHGYPTMRQARMDAELLATHFAEAEAER